MQYINGDAVVDFEEMENAPEAPERRKKILTGILLGSAAVALAALGFVVLQRRKRSQAAEEAAF